MALKWTNAPFAVGIMVAAIVAQPHESASQRLRITLSVLAALVGGFMLLYGWWGMRLWQEFGSPLFPLFNGFFGSPDAPAESFSYQRYVPQTLGQLASFPFRMALHEGWVHTEVISPDLRPATITLLSVAACLAWGVTRLRASPPQASLHVLRTRREVHVVAAFGLVSLAAWLVTSSNGRYAVPLFLLQGPVLVLLMARMLNQRSALVAGALLTVLQVLHGAAGGSPRWSAQPWTQDWLPVTVPSSLVQEPMLFVLVGQPSASFLAKHVHPRSVFINPIGTMPLPNDGPGWARYVKLRDGYQGRTQVVMPMGLQLTDAEFREKLVRQNRVLRFGPEGPVDEGRLVACKAIRVAPNPELAASRNNAARIMDAFEARCPSVFSPRGTQIEGAGSMWTRAYSRHDVYLAIDVNAGAILYRRDRQMRPEMIGSVSSWKSDLERFRCKLPLDGQRGIDTMFPHDATR
jgi:hypothetical protein